MNMAKWGVVALAALLWLTPVQGLGGQEAEKSKEEQAQGVGKLLERVEQLEKQLTEIQQAREDEELEKLRLEADTEAASAQDEREKLEEKTYVTASRSLQMLNPEISVSGDFVGQVIFDEDMEAFFAGADDRSAMVIRALDLHIQSSLDPFSLTKIAIGISPPGELMLEEIYVTWTGVIPGAKVTAGHFRQPFGVVNRWHQHDLDQTNYPLVIYELLGADGMDQSGVSLEWMMPALWADANSLILQVTNGSNEERFAGDFFSIPSTLLRITSYWDLSENTYLDLGLTGMFGMNNKRGFESEHDPDVLMSEDWRPTYMAGADLTLHWQPLKQARYSSLTWRTEGIWVRQEMETEVQSGWGLYTYLQTQLGAAWFVGLRGDLVQPLWDQDKLLWQAVPYLTFWQSEFVYLRLEASHGEVAGGHDSRVVLQINWSAGPHKHEKY